MKNIAQKILEKKDIILKRIWIVQLLIGIPMLLFGYQLGHRKWHLLLNGVKTTGQVIATQEIQFQRSRTWSTTESLPIIEYIFEGQKYSFKGEKISPFKSTGYSVAILVDPDHPEQVMVDDKVLHFPWLFFIGIGLLLTVVGIKTVL